MWHEMQKEQGLTVGGKDRPTGRKVQCVAIAMSSSLLRRFEWSDIDCAAVLSVVLAACRRHILHYDGAGASLARLHTAVFAHALVALVVTYGVCDAQGRRS